MLLHPSPVECFLTRGLGDSARCVRYPPSGRPERFSAASMATTNNDNLSEVKHGDSIGTSKLQGQVHTRPLPDDDGGYGPRKSHISLTQIDEGDMYRLGKKQELNVREAPLPFLPLLRVQSSPPGPVTD